MSQGQFCTCGRDLLPDCTENPDKLTELTIAVLARTVL